MRTAAAPPAARRSVYVGPYSTLVNRAARRNGLDPWLLAALLWVESKFNPHARSSTGDVGIAQINLASHPNVTAAEARDPAFAIPWAARYLAELKVRTGSTKGALRAYNTGSGAASPAGDRYAARVLGARKSALTASRELGHGGALAGKGYAGVDQGVDFTDKGAIPALDAATVTDVGQVPIRQGATVPYVIYRLDAGPHRGKFVYVMETFNPSVKVGQRLRAGQPIGYATGGGYGIEIGFNRTAKGQNAVGPDPTRPNPAGYQMLGYLERLGLHGSTVPRVTKPKKGGGGGGILGGIGGAVWGAATNPFLDPIAGAVDGAKGAYNAVTGAAGTVTGAAKGIAGLGELAGRILTDPGYVFLWLGFAVVGLAFIFLGVERLLGRSATADARSAAGAGVNAVTLVAAPEAAAVGGVA